MKFFLEPCLAWPDNSVDEEFEHDLEKFSNLLKSAVSSYHLRINEIKPSLPSDVVEIADPFEVDDAVIARVVHRDAEQRLDLTLRCGNLQVGYYDLTLTYEQPDMELEHRESLDQISRATIGGGNWSNDCYCHELDLLDDGRIEHRLLFNSYEDGGPDFIWFAIRCHQMSVVRISRPDRDIPPIEERFSPE